MQIQGTSGYIQQESPAEALIQIKDQIQGGKDAALFIGRQPGEKLPEAVDNLFWVSLDLGAEGATAEKSRIHIQLDINDTESLPKFNGLFTKVVVDQSTWKFFEGKTRPIDRLTLLLDKSKPNELIFESFFQFAGLSESYSFDQVVMELPEKELEQYQEKLNNIWQEYSDQTCKENQMKEFKEFLVTDLCPAYKKALNKGQLEENDCMPEFIRYIQVKGAEAKGIKEPFVKYSEISRQRTVEHLETLFDDVSLVQDSAYPYETRYSKGHDMYYHARNAKKD